MYSSLCIKMWSVLLMYKLSTFTFLAFNMFCFLSHQHVYPSPNLRMGASPATHPPVECLLMAL